MTEIEKNIYYFHKQMKEKFNVKLKTIIVRDENLKKIITPDDVCNVIFELTGFTKSDISKKSRGGGLPLIRQLAFVFCYDYAFCSVTEIAKIFNRDHTTVVYGRKKISEYLKIKDERTTILHAQILEKLLNSPVGE